MGKGKKLRAEHGGEVYEGDRLYALLGTIRKETESSKLSTLDGLPVKFWYKQQFAIGVNEVTRVLERMSPWEVGSAVVPPHRESSCLKLQAVLVAGDCNPRWLTKHLPSLASSRKVPLMFVEDNKKGSFKLGELVMMKSAIAVGIKDKGTTLNRAIADFFELSKSPY